MIRILENAAAGPQRVPIILLAVNDETRNTVELCRVFLVQAERPSGIVMHAAG
jgi:hypothetical protein